MSEKSTMNRRYFLRNSALGIIGAGVIGTEGNVLAKEEKKKETPELKINSYRTLGRTGFKVSDISSGGPENIAVLNAMLDAGVNYIDTAESYVNGQSEIATGKAIKGRDRKKIFITSKLVLKDNDTQETILKRSYKCLERLDTPYLDCMMMHSAPRVKSIKNPHFHGAMDQLKKEGKLRFVGISNHGSQWKDDVDPMADVCVAAAKDGRFDVMLLVYNFIQKEEGERILAACKANNVGVTLMKTNPIGGYMGIKEELDKMKKEGKEIPSFYPRIMNKLKAKADKAQQWADKNQLKNPAEVRNAAIKFAMNHPAVATVCCSLRNFDDVEAFLKLSGSPITMAEKKKLAAYKEGCADLYCRHACGKCESQCPHDVPVNTIMRYNHYYEAQGREKHALQKYAQLNTAKADKCSSCSGHCEAACPYGVPVHGLLALAHERLTLV